MLNDFDRRDTTILKGLAIIAIVFHNFFHLVSPVHQNEFGFNPARFQRFLQALGHPELSVQSAFSFFGHYGVQVFIFLSAYGLARSHWNDPSDWITFMWSRIRKIYPMFLTVYLCWLVLVSTQVGPENAVKDSIVELACMLTGLSNVLPGHHTLPVGPWWFIPFIIQFYAIWPILRKLTVRFGLQGLLVVAAVCLALTCFANPMLATWGGNLLETPIGRMSSICLGIAAARYPIRIRADVAIASFAVLILGSIYKSIWPLTFFASLIVALVLYSLMRERLRKVQLLEVIGRYSMLLFLWNGVVRVPFVTMAKTPLTQLIFGSLSAVVTFGMAALTQEVAVLVSTWRERAATAATMVYSDASGLGSLILRHRNWQRFLLRGLVYGSDSGHIVITRPARIRDRSL